MGGYPASMSTIGTFMIVLLSCLIIIILKKALKGHLRNGNGRKEITQGPVRAFPRRPVAINPYCHFVIIKAG
jgi:hypothetical protein